MSSRTVALAGTLAFIALLAGLTVDVMLNSGIDVLVVVSLIVLAMVGFGVLGALFNPPSK